MAGTTSWRAEMLVLLRAEGPNFYELGASSSLQQRTYYYYIVLPLAGIRSLLGLELTDSQTDGLCELVSRDPVGSSRSSLITLFF